jgi:hypothetical protein
MVQAYKTARVSARAPWNWQTIIRGKNQKCDYDRSAQSMQTTRVLLAWACAIIDAIAIAIAWCARHDQGQRKEPLAHVPRDFRV